MNNFKKNTPQGTEQKENVIKQDDNQKKMQNKLFIFQQENYIERKSEKGSDHCKL